MSCVVLFFSINTPRTHTERLTLEQTLQGQYVCSETVQVRRKICSVGLKTLMMRITSSFVGLLQLCTQIVVSAASDVIA